jgi:hypothetical protein
MRSTLQHPVTWRRHNCARQHRSEEAFLKCAAKTIRLVHGSGPFAVLCDREASLYPTQSQAEALVRHLDDYGCSCPHSRPHRVVFIDVEGDWS